MLLALITLTMPIIAVNEIRTVGNTGADYTTLKIAFDAVNNGTLTGNVTLRIIANTTETASAVLNASGSGSANYNSVNIYPTAANLTVSGNLNAPLIDLNGADNVEIDGRVNATGAAVSLTITNTNTSSGTTSTIRFVNDASTNTIRYCQIKGSQTNAASSIVFFSTTTGANGNDNNTITNNHISSSSNVFRPVNVVYSEGSPGIDNNNNTISNNNIFDFFNRSITSCAINISANSSAYTISNNSFYETTTFIPAIATSATYSFVYINNTSGSGFQIQDNYIGGSAPLCTGTAWTKTNNANNAFNGIYVAVGTDSPTQINGNKISNFSWNNISSGNWIGIQAQSGVVNIGSISGNTIGEITGTSSILFKSDNIGPNMYPIQLNSNNNINCISNKIGALKVTNARYMICINKNSDDGNSTISNNTIGSTSTSASIEVTTSPLLTTHFFVGLHAQGATNTVNNNIISNLISNSTGNGNVRGIEILTGSNTVSGNTISKIASASSNSTPLTGLYFSNSFDNTISGNSIIEIESTNASNNNGSVIGMNMDFTGTNIITKNFIRDILVPAATSNTKIYGIKTVNGSATYSNNVVSLGTSVTTNIYGIYESGSQDCNMYHNTVYINGTPTSGALNSYAFYSASNANTINYINNIFVNSRSNSGATGKNYAAFFNYGSAGSLTLNYNVYYTTGTGGVLGYFASADRINVPIVVGLDANSLKIAPGFLNAGGSNATDYKPVITKFDGIAGTGVGTDFGGATRTSVPTIGAWEFAGGNMWKGSVSNDWANLLNWTLSTIPASGDNILFDPYPVNHLVMDADRTVNNITNSQSTYRLVVNGKRLTMQGAISFTNGAQIDASAINSVLVYAGTTQQHLNSAWLLNGEVFSVRLNNLNPVILSGTLVLLNSISTGGGRLNATINSPTMIYRGVAAQTISISIYLLNQIYNLTIDNSIGVTINAPLIVSNALTINSAKRLTLAPNSRLQVNGVIANNAGANGLIINSTAVGTASLIHNTNNIQATARRYIGGNISNAWHFLSTPILNQSLSGDWKPTGTNSDGTGYDLYVWDEPTNCWVYNLNNTIAPTWNSVHPSTNFISGKGYLYALQAVNTTKEFTGILNNGNISVNLTNSSSKSFKGFNFLGNPYPSSIDWKNNAGFTRTMLESTGGGYNIWIWSYTANNYGVYNSADLTDSGTNNSTRYISPNMGFFVKAASAGTFVFSNLARVSNEAGSWLRVKTDKTSSPSLSIKVNSVDSLGSDEVKMNFGLDLNQPGASKMFSPIKTAPSLFIMNENEEFSTFYLTTTTENSTVELNFKAGKDGKYTLSADEFKNNFDVVLLEDKKTEKIIDLKATDNYIFTSKTTDNSARFNIHFSEKAITDYALNFANVHTIANDINIDLKGLKGNFKIKIFDINGVVLNEFTAVGGEQRIVPNPSKGVVFLKLYNKEKTKTFKLLN
jgi:hypothetical protein